jgi:hypothetical protein
MKLIESRSYLAPQELSNDVFPPVSPSAREVLIPEIGKRMVFIDSGEGAAVPYDSEIAKQRAERARTSHQEYKKKLGRTAL